MPRLPDQPSQAAGSESGPWESPENVLGSEGQCLEGEGVVESPSSVQALPQGPCGQGVRAELPHLHALPAQGLAGDAGCGQDTKS